MERQRVISPRISPNKKLNSINSSPNNKRPDSMKVELLSIPEHGKVISFSNVGNNDSVVSVGFKDISCKVQLGLIKRRTRTLLDNVSGEFCAGELTAIMGPSGSGKSTLMNILAGFTTKNVTGEKHLNSEPRNEDLYRKQSCYIMQDDNLQPLLTVQEAMYIAADLKISRDKEKKARIKEILDSMNLWVHRKTRTEKLSGGQKKRLAIALELLNNPQVMLLDEPTSGLDSLHSKQCIMLLKQLAMSGRVIICTIHQPSASIFEMFDHLYVLGYGKCVYQGSPKGLHPYLDEENLRCPEYHNPADYLLEVISGDYGDYIDQLSHKAQNGLNSEWRKNQSSIFNCNSFDRIGNMMRSGQITPVYAPPIAFPKLMLNCDKTESACTRCCQGSYSTSYLNQFSVLLKRTFIILSRDKTLTYSRLLTHTSIAIFMGILYYGIGTDASNMLNNFNFMFFTVMFLMLTAFNCVATTFPTELPILTREHFNKWYSLKSYYLAISLADIPVQITATVIYALTTYFLTHQPLETYRIWLFLVMCILISLVAQSFGLLIGACLNIKNGVIFGPFCFLPFVIFSGFFVQLNAAHPYLRWIFHISYLKYGFEGMVLSVLGYERAKMPCDADYCQFVYPMKFLKQMNMDNAKYSTAVIVLISLVVIIRLVAYFALSIQIRCNRQRK